MVDRQQIYMARQQLSQQDQALQAQRKTIESYNPLAKQSEMVLRGGGLSGMQKAQILEQQKVQAKETALKEQTKAEQQYQQQVQPIKEQINLAEKSLNEIDAIQEDYAAAQSAADSQDARAVFGLENARQKQFYSEIVKGQSAYTSYSNLVTKLKGEGFNPVFDNTGKLVSVTDSKDKQNYDLSKLSGQTNLPENLINRMEKAGLVTVTRTTTTTEIPKPSTYISFDKSELNFAPQEVRNKFVKIEDTRPFILGTDQIYFSKKPLIEKGTVTTMPSQNYFLGPTPTTGNEYTIFERAIQIPSTAGKGIEEASRFFISKATDNAKGEYLAQPKIEIPQRVTIGGQENLYIPERKGYLLTEDIPKVLGKTTELGIWAVTPAKYTSPVLIIGGAQSYINPLRTPAEKTSGIINIGFGTAIGGIAGYRYLSTPIVKPANIPKTNIYAFERIYPETKEGVRGTFYLQKVIGPQKIIETTRFRDIFNLKPLRTYTIPAKVYTAASPFSIFTKEGVVSPPAIIKSQRSGANVYTIGRVGGETTTATAEELSRLSNIDKYIFKKMTKQTEPFIMNANNQYSLANIYSSKSFKTTADGKDIIFYPNSKVSSARAVGIIKKIPTVDQNIEKYFTYTGYKTVTSPFAKSAGNIQTIKGISIIDINKGATKELGSGINKAINLGGLKIESIKPIAKISSGQLKLLKSIKESEIGALEQMPKVNILSTTKTITKSSPILNIGAASALSLKEESIIKPKSIQKVEQKNETLLKTESIIKPKNIFIFKESTKTNEANKNIQIEIPLLKEFQLEQPKTALKEQTQQITRVNQVNIFKEGFNVTPTTKTILKPIMTEEEKKKKALDFFKLKKSKAFEVQYRKKGKFETIGKNLPIGKSLELGTKATTTSLRQTFRLLPKGETTMKDISFNVPSDIFTRPRKPTTSLEFTERRGKTLKRGTGEIPEIMRAKKQSNIFSSKPTKSNQKFFKL